MALSEIKRQRIRNTKEVLESIKSENTVDTGNTHIDEATSGKFRDMNEVEKYLNDRQFSYVELNSFKTAASEQWNGRDDFNISIFFMSNKFTKVNESEDNYISLSFSLEDEESGEIRVYDNRYAGRNTSFEKFMELPVGVEGDTDEQIWEVVDKCDTAYMYDLYIEDALKLVSKGMNTAYQLFKNPNLYKTMDRSITSLGVTYMPKLKKFVYLYNPDFILTATLEEWMKNKKSYESLRACYVYLLAYFITHEMMHIIYNNTSTDNDGAGITDIELSGDSGVNHEITNMVQDSFINSELAIRFKRYSGTFGVRNTKDLAPVPKIGIDSRLCLRGQHNVGFKEYKTEKELVETITNLYTKTAKIGDFYLRSNYDEDYSLEKFKGADIYILVDIDPRSRDIRQSSIVFQKFINDLVRLVTDGDIYNRFTEFTEEEKITDKGILPNGSLVRIKQTVDICIVVGYDESTGMYKLNSTDSVLDKEPQSDGTIKCSYKYTDSGDFRGEFRRTAIIPFKEDSYDNVWYEGVKKEEKRKLEPEDIKGGGGGGMPPMPPIPPMPQEEPPKVFNIGDVVYIRTAGVFGRITGIHDGRFELEEMREENARIIDDSLYH